MNTEARPPSYATTVDVDEISVVATSGKTDSPTYSTSSSTLFDEFEDIYDPSLERYIEDPKQGAKKSEQRTRDMLVPMRNQTAPAVFEVAMQRPLLTEKRPRPKVVTQAAASKSPRPVVYSFIPSATGNNSTALVPLAEAADKSSSNATRYTINVSMNCFMPSSYITRVYHATTLIGEFEMGLISSGVSSKVKVGQHSLAISNVVSKSGGRDAGSWFWNPFGMKEDLFLKWDYSTRPCTCYATAGKKNILAKFTSPYGLNETNEPAMLEVLPAGQEPIIFEHILIFLLIVERKRLTPDRASSFKPLFN